MHAAGQEISVFSYEPGSSSGSVEPEGNGPEVELTKEQLVQAVNGLAAVEKQLIQYAGSNSALATYLTELLQNTAGAEAAIEDLA